MNLKVNITAEVISRFLRENQITALRTFIAIKASLTPEKRYLKRSELAAVLPEYNASRLSQALIQLEKKGAINLTRSKRDGRTQLIYKNNDKALIDKAAPFVNMQIITVDTQALLKTPTDKLRSILHSQILTETLPKAITRQNIRESLGAARSTQYKYEKQNQIKSEKQLIKTTLTDDTITKLDKKYRKHGNVIYRQIGNQYYDGRGASKSHRTIPRIISVKHRAGSSVANRVQDAKLKGQYHAS